MRRFLLAFAVLAILPVQAQAAKLSPTSIMGRWCGDVANYNFTRSALIVTRKGQKKPETIKLKGVAVLEKEIQVFFADPYGGGIRLADFSENGREMAQQGSPFGSMPKRVFKRC